MARAFMGKKTAEGEKAETSEAVVTEAEDPRFAELVQIWNQAWEEVAKKPYGVMDIRARVRDLISVFRKNAQAAGFDLMSEIHPYLNKAFSGLMVGESVDEAKKKGRNRWDDKKCKKCGSVKCSCDESVTESQEVPEIDLEQAILSYGKYQLHLEGELLYDFVKNALQAVTSVSQPTQAPMDMGMAPEPEGLDFLMGDEEMPPMEGAELGGESEAGEEEESEEEED
jgi:hypothetical protein